MRAFPKGSSIQKNTGQWHVPSSLLSMTKFQLPQLLLQGVSHLDLLRDLISAIP